MKISTATPTPLEVAGRIAAAGALRALPDPTEPNTLAAARDVIRALRTELTARDERIQQLEVEGKELRAKLLLAEHNGGNGGKSTSPSSATRPALAKASPSPSPAAKAPAGAFGLMGSDRAWHESIKAAEAQLAEKRAELDSAASPIAKTVAFREFRKAEKALADARRGRAIR